ncbi:SCP2 sterol-binding domain-containing protein [Gaertneriomyces semiglobifer]|nr:SCP2 sterol-binding domain-containing protein [Gaertneriomyces semiglobifer]
MSVNVPGFKSGALFEQIKAGVEGAPAAERAAMVKKVNGVFEMIIKNAEGKEQSWTLELKKEGKVYAGKPEGKADIVINLTDDTFQDLASGKLNGQKAFMSGKLKVKGNMMLATRLDAVLKAAKNAPKAAPAASPAAAPAASSVEVPGFQSSALFQQIATGIATAPPQQKESVAKKAKAIFQFDVKNAEGKVQTWVLDLKSNLGVSTTVGPKPDIVITIADKVTCIIAL